MPRTRSTRKIIRLPRTGPAAAETAYAVVVPVLRHPPAVEHDDPVSETARSTSDGR
jgi:hypothetical protein